MSGTVGTGGTGISLSLLPAHAHLSQHKKMVVPVVPPMPRLSIKGARQRQPRRTDTPPPPGIGSLLSPMAPACGSKVLLSSSACLLPQNKVNLNPSKQRSSICQ